MVCSFTGPCRYGKSTAMVWKGIGAGLMTILPAMCYTLKVGRMVGEPAVEGRAACCAGFRLPALENGMAQ